MTSFPQDTVDSFHYHIGGGGVPADSLAYVKRSADDQLYELLQAGGILLCAECAADG
ncbi:MAG: hypothetical protein HC860_25845 [Alkalinema sp. RU_4_3]|nr:hypothetical protein [Alkalinema sp. RU_4_3]